MGDRVDELKGNLKEVRGKVTRNRKVEAEGESEANAARAKRRVKGSVEEAGGTLQEGLGKVTSDKSMEAKGKSARVRGESARTR